MDEATKSEPVSKPRRLGSIDTYRGLVMFLLMAEALHFAQVAEKVPDRPVWSFLAHHQTHVEWVGCAIHDLIQPSFSFLVGVALPFSMASRMARGQSRAAMTVHALWRAFLLVALGIFLRSTGSQRTNYTFEDTLTQIGLGYPFLFLLGFASQRMRWLALAVILIGYWGAFAAYRPPADFDQTRYGVTEEWAAEHNATGFASHWNKNANLAWAADRWFLNLFPREKPFEFNGGGYSTLSFIPTLGTMLLGLIAGAWLKSDRSFAAKLGLLVITGLICLGLGYGLHFLGVCPNVKRIWTPTWTLFSGGLCFLILAFLVLVVDGTSWNGWSYPLKVIGRNSIAIYCMENLFGGFIYRAWERHLGSGAFDVFGPEYAPLVHGGLVMLTFWLILFWMDREKIYIKI
jgi:heparan-alpha-glucosaminide N-acetyltransferase